MSESPRSGISRETRMLLIVITLSVVVLVVLSRFRFPDNGGRPDGATPLPLERLAARATYEELATIIAELGRGIAPKITVLRVEADGEQRFVPALRVRPDLLLAHISGDSRIHELIGLDAPVDIAGFDDTRDLVLLRVPADPLRVVALDSPSAITARPRYVAAVEGTPGGPTLRPLFLGRMDFVADPNYPEGTVVLGGVLVASPGSFIFGLDGTFVGLCVVDGGYAAGVTGRALQAALDRMLVPAAR